MIKMFYRHGVENTALLKFQESKDTNVQYIKGNETIKWMEFEQWTHQITLGENLNLRVCKFYCQNLFIHYLI